MFFQRFSGANAFNFYAVSIFSQTLTGINPYWAAIAIGFVQLLASLLSGKANIPVWAFVRHSSFYQWRKSFYLFRISDRHCGKAAPAHSQHCLNVSRPGRVRQLRLLQFNHETSSPGRCRIRGNNTSRTTRLDPIALCPGIHDCPGSGHLANLLAIDWGVVPPRVSRPRFQSEHKLQLRLCLLRCQTFRRFSTGKVTTNVT